VVRIHYKPFVLWIWLGAVLMAFGGVLAITDKRYRSSKVVVQNESTATSANNNSKAKLAVES